VSNRYSIKIQHAENDGEYRIPGTRYRCDGFHKESNTIFEFHGDCFHGKPKKYKKNDKPNPFSNLTALQLYRKTKAREKELKELGYFVCTIWESDYKSLSKRDRSIITI
jgi:G:T-mismatch repair DNA endonuclease (very short patch repair protein)